MTRKKKPPDPAVFSFVGRARRRQAATDRFSGTALWALQHLGDRAEQLVDLRLVDDQRRRQRDDVAGGADQHALVSKHFRKTSKARAVGLPGDRLQLDAADQAEVADVDDVRQALQRVRRVLPIGRDRAPRGRTGPRSL